MHHTITINNQSCNDCNICVEVCPNKIMRKIDSQITVREDRLQSCIKCGQCMAVCPAMSIQVGGLSYEKDFFPLPPEESHEHAFYNLIATRRAIRNFEDRPVPGELLEKIITAVSFAPPSFPPIKTEVIIVQNTAIIRQALPTMIGMYGMLVKAMRNPIARLIVKQSAGAEKFKVLKKHVIPLMIQKMPDLKAGIDDSITYHAPAMIIYHASRNTENYYPDIYIAMTYGILAAHALGLGATIIDLIPPVIERTKKLRKLFDIPDGNEVVASMILGYPRYKYLRGIKRNLNSVTWI